MASSFGGSFQKVSEQKSPALGRAFSLYTTAAN